MCGIVGYVGARDCREILLKGLGRLEYRGYDSAGIAILNDGIHVAKCAGKVRDLESRLAAALPAGMLGIGHTRWATHGPPDDTNAHPHLSQSGAIALVHNGIIENYAALKQMLAAKGRLFKSQTDSEVVVQLIEEILAGDRSLAFEAAIRLALRQVAGTYGLAIVHAAEPERLYVARRGSPLLVGLGEGESFVASDATPIVEYTNKVVYLDDGELAVIGSGSCDVRTIDDVPLTKEVHELTLSLDAIEKVGFPHFMLKEIHEQPRDRRLSAWPAPSGRRRAARRTLRDPRPRRRRSTADDRRLRHELAFGARGRIPDRAPRPAARRGGVCLGVPLP